MILIRESITSRQPSPLATCHATRKSTIAVDAIGMKSVRTCHQPVACISKDALNSTLPIPQTIKTVLSMVLNNFFISPFYNKSIELQ